MNFINYECSCGATAKFTVEATAAQKWPLPGGDIARTMQQFAAQFENFSLTERITLLALLRERYSPMTGDFRR